LILLGFLLVLSIPVFISVAQKQILTSELLSISVKFVIVIEVVTRGDISIWFLLCATDALRATALPWLCYVNYTCVTRIYVFSETWLQLFTVGSCWIIMLEVFNFGRRSFKC